MMLVGAWGHDEPRIVDWAVGAALLMRRSVVEEVGGFDERFFMYAEDLEWCWRATRAGHPIWFEPGAIVRHVGGASSSQSYGARTPVAYMRNTYRFFRRTHGPLTTAAYRAANLAGNARLIGWHLLRAEPGPARYWAVHARGNLTSTRGIDGPPTA
jgi:GT2 family glycosyltransferase